MDLTARVHYYVLASSPALSGPRGRVPPRSIQSRVRRTVPAVHQRSVEVEVIGWKLQGIFFANITHRTNLPDPKYESDQVEVLLKKPATAYCTCAP